MSKTKQKLPEKIGDLTGELCDRLQVAGVIVVTREYDGKIGMASRGLNHMKANELLSVAIHLNLSDHDRHVLAGAAGPEAQRAAQDMKLGE